MDVRALIMGVVALASIVGAVVLYLNGDADAGERLAGLAAAASTYLAGLYSSPYDAHEEPAA